MNVLVNTGSMLNRGMHVLAATNATDYFESVENKVVDALNGIIPFVWLVVAIALVGIGLACIIGSDRSKEAAKSKAVYVIVGCGVVLGAMYIATGVAGILSMGDFVNT